MHNSKKMQVNSVSHALPWSTASTASTASAHSKAPLRLSMSQDEPTSKLIALQQFRAAADSSGGAVAARITGRPAAQVADSSTTARGDCTHDRSRNGFILGGGRRVILSGRLFIGASLREAVVAGHGWMKPSLFFFYL